MAAGGPALRSLDRFINLVLLLGMCVAGLGFIGSLTAIALSRVQGDRAYFGWYVPAAFCALGLGCIGLRRVLVKVSPQAQS